MIAATTAFGGAVLVLDFDRPMTQETPEATPAPGNSVYWNFGGVPYACLSEETSLTYTWNSPTQVAISSNSDAEVSEPDTCTWMPDEASTVRFRSVEGVYLAGFNNFPLT